MNASLALAGLIFLVVASLGVAAYAYMLDRSRRGLISRTDADAGRTGAVSRLLGMGVEAKRESFAKRVAGLLPENFTSSEKTEHQLVQAGFDSATAPLTYGMIRAMLLVGLPVLAVLFAPKATFARFVMYVACAALVGALVPVYYMVRRVRLRQERIRRSLPDALDLLVVCIEAGISLDAAILRVARELWTVHPELSSELLIVNRKTNAGLSREEALRGLWDRTGVQEIRALVSHIVQSEKWGTSSGKVLRVYAETLRKQRRQKAEKTAATLPVKMLLPLGVFIFPSIFVVILGPVAMSVLQMFKK
jgi:tight adherence protein C